MSAFRCPKCGRVGSYGETPRVRCSCGYRCDADCLEANAVTAQIRRTRGAPEFPCTHRGPSLGVLDCGCSGRSTVYSCSIHGECMPRKLKPAIGPDATCNICEHRNSPVKYAAIITTHFNPAGHSRLRETWRQWYQALYHNHECWELVLGDAKPEIPRSVVVRGDAANAIWQKERLINLAIESLPDSVRYVAWVDHDLILANPRWLETGCQMIDDGFDAVQLFDQVTYLNAAGLPIQTTPAAAATLASGGIPGYAPGGAWIASRAFLGRVGGLYERNVVGGGDAVFFSGITGARTSFLDRQPPGVRADARAWIDSVGECRWGYVQGTANHIWHGDRRNRQYISRDEILCRHEFDPRQHLRIGANGLLELSNAPAGLADDIARYFADRRDDG